MKKYFLRTVLLMCFTICMLTRTADSYAAPGGTCADSLSDDVTCAAYLNTRIAMGEYQTVIDQIEPIVTDLKPYQKYFLGAAYFGLSGRAGAHSLKCHYSLLAKTNLGQFMENRMQVYESQRTLGDTEELKYAYAASRMVKLLEKLKGCEESSESTGALNQFGSSFLRQRIKDLFYGYPAPEETQTGIESVFTNGMTNMQGKVRGYVSVASKMERDYQLIGLELQTGLTYLEEIKNIIEGSFGSAVGESPLVEWLEDESIGVPIYMYTANVNELYNYISDMTGHYLEIREPEGSMGKVQTLVNEIMAKQQATGMADYAEKRTKIIERLESTAFQMTVIYNLSVELGGGSGFGAITAATDSPGATLTDQWLQIESQWKEAKFGCAAQSTQWYCQSGTANEV